MHIYKYIKILIYTLYLYTSQTTAQTEIPNVHVLGVQWDTVD